jgi:DHA1 family tetracycline resistance protein-like MFS transporter
MLRVAVSLCGGESRELRRMTTLPTASARRPAVGFVFVTGVLIVLGWGIISPVLPGLITEFEGGDAAAGARTYGWILGSFAIMQFLGAPLLGVLSDRFGRRKVILVTLAGSALDYLVMGWAPTIVWLFGARVVSGFFGGAMSTCNAYVADVTPPDRRAHGFGVLGAAFGIGFVLGPALGGFLGEVDLRLPFFVAAGAVALNWAYGALLLPESLPADKRRAFSWRRANPVGGLSNLRRFPGIFGLAGVYFLSVFGTMMLHSTWVLYTGYRYGWTPRQVGISLMLVGLSAIVVQGRLVGLLLPRIGEKRGLILGLSITACVTILYGLANEGWMIYPLICVGALGGLTGPSVQTLITRKVPADEQGAVQGALASLSSLATVFAPPIAAWSFAACVGPAAIIHLPGIAFFEASAVVLMGLVLAVRSLRSAGSRGGPSGP